MDGFSRDKESTTTSIVYTKHIQVGVKGKQQEQPAAITP